MIYNDPMLWPKKAQKVTLTLTGTWNKSATYIKIGDVTYSGKTNIGVDIGTQVYCYATGTETLDGTIYLNGTLVAHNSYNYVATVNAEIKANVMAVSPIMYITET